MHRAIRYGTLIGALMLSAACENQSGAPGESTFIPRPEYVSAETASAQMHTRVSGFIYDPEAFFISVATCQSCPFPPFLLDNSPLFLRSVLRGASVSMWDPATGQNAQVQPASSDGLGNFTVERVPSREEPYFLPSTPGGELPLATNIPFPLPPIPPAKYLPTVTYRPVLTGHGGCMGVDANAVSEKGILEAVAKYLTFVENTPTSVADFVDPSKYQSVSIFWHHFPGFLYLRAPADGVSMEATSGRVLNVIWAPPGALPPSLEPLRSTRGFVVIPGSTSSSLGINVALLQASSTPPATVTYQMKDGTTNANLLRPWTHPAITLKPAPGVITYADVQVHYSNGPTTRTISPAMCRLPIP